MYNPVNQNVSRVVYFLLITFARILKCFDIYLSCCPEQVS